MIAWQKARELSKLIYEYTYYELFSKDFSLKNQIRESSGSVMDNIAEGFERRGNREFIQFLPIAKGYCGEAKSQLYCALDQIYINEHQSNTIYNLAEETSNYIGKLMNYLINSELKGTKFTEEKH